MNLQERQYKVADFAESLDDWTEEIRAALRRSFNAESEEDFGGCIMRARDAAKALATEIDKL